LYYFLAWAAYLLERMMFIPDDIIHTLRQEWAAYLLERWSWYHRN